MRSGHFADELLSRLVDAAPDGILMTDHAGRILLANTQMEAMFGYRRAELLGRSVDALVPEHLLEAHRAHRARFDADPAPRPMGSGLELVGRRADGSEFPVEISLSPVLVRGEQCVVAAVRDITDRVAAQARAQVLQERERVARDLHDLVIQRLFATGMAAQLLQARLEDPGLAARAAGIVDDLDDTIREIRAVIFGLHHPSGEDDRGGLRARIAAVLDEQHAALGFAPSLEVVGDVDDVAPDVMRQLVAIVREALVNVARHARASSVEVRIGGRDDEVVCCVSDDGVGFDPQSRGAGEGLVNMRERAQALGGDVTVGPAHPRGTAVSVRIARRPVP